MRSDLVFTASQKIPNRFMLCRLASESARRLHKTTTSIQDSLNEVFTVLGGDQAAVVKPAPLNTPVIALEAMAFE